MKRRWSRRTWISRWRWRRRCWPGFTTPKEGGFYDSAAGAKDLILRVKEDYDGAEPSGNSTAVLALLRLAAITEPEGIQGGGGENAAAFCGAPAGVAPGRAALVDGAGLSFARTDARGGGGRPGATRRRRPCSMPSTASISRTKWCWATAGRWRTSPRRCRRRTRRWFISAPAPPASRRQATPKPSSVCWGKRSRSTRPGTVHANVGHETATQHRKQDFSETGHCMPQYWRSA